MAQSSYNTDPRACFSLILTTGLFGVKLRAVRISPAAPCVPRMAVGDEP